VRRRAGCISRKGAQNVFHAKAQRREECISRKGAKAQRREGAKALIP